MIGEAIEGLIQRAYYHLGIKWGNSFFDKVLIAPTQTKSIVVVTLDFLKVLVQPTQTKNISTVSLEVSKTLTKPTENVTII